MDELLEKLKSISLWRIVKSLPFDGGASSTKWVYLACAFVVNMCLVAMVASLCWEYIHHGRVDVALVGLIGTTIGIVVGIPASSANLRRKLNTQASDKPGGKTAALIAIVLIGTLVFATPARAQDQVYKFSQMSATGQTSAINVVGSAAQFGTSVNAPSTHIVWASVTGSPTTCSFKIYGTLKLLTDNPVYPQDYFEISSLQDCSVPSLAAIASTDRPATTILINLVTFSGGTSPKVTFYYLGKAR